MSARPIHAADIDALLHPAGAFAHPQDVVSDPDMILYEKRAILSSWASDACAVEDMPAVRSPNGINEEFDDIIDALQALDTELELRGGAGCRIDRMRYMWDSELTDMGIHTQWTSARSSHPRARRPIASSTIKGIAVFRRYSLEICRHAINN